MFVIHIRVARVAVTILLFIYHSHSLKSLSIQWNEVEYYRIPLQTQTLYLDSIVVCLWDKVGQTKALLQNICKVITIAGRVKIQK